MRGLRLRATALALGAALWLGFYVAVALSGGLGYDSHAYWLTRHGIHYASDPGQRDAYLYSPAFSDAIRPLTLLPWPVFALIWSSLATITYLWLVRNVEPRWRIPLGALCLSDIVYGNVWWLLALTLALGLRRPALWAIPILLKLTPAVGVIWFAVRREWRNLIIALTVAGAIAAASFCLAPGVWADWIAMLAHGHPARFPDRPLPRATRILAGFALTAYAARRNRPRILPAALWLASPVFSLNGIAVCAALGRLDGRRPDNAGDERSRRVSLRKRDRRTLDQTRPHTSAA